MADREQQIGETGSHWPIMTNGLVNRTRLKNHLKTAIAMDRSLPLYTACTICLQGGIAGSAHFAGLQSHRYRLSSLTLHWSSG